MLYPFSQDLNLRVDEESIAQTRFPGYWYRNYIQMKMIIGTIGDAKNQ
jgi:hypothetical protein